MKAKFGYFVLFGACQHKFLTIFRSYRPVIINLNSAVGC
jgi:hypothetical protein